MPAFPSRIMCTSAYKNQRFAVVDGYLTHLPAAITHVKNTVPLTPPFIRMANVILVTPNEIRTAGGIPGDSGLIVTHTHGGKHLYSERIAEARDVLTGLVIAGNSRIVATGKGELLFWNAERLTWNRVQAHHGPITQLIQLTNVTGEDGGVASAGADGRIGIWSHSGANRGYLEGHTLGINALQQGDKGTLFSVADDRTIRIWDTVELRQRRFIRGLRDSGAFLMIGSDNWIHIVDVLGHHYTLDTNLDLTYQNSFTSRPALCWHNKDSAQMLGFFLSGAIEGSDLRR